MTFRRQTILRKTTGLIVKAEFAEWSSKKQQRGNGRSVTFLPSVQLFTLAVPSSFWGFSFSLALCLKTHSGARDVSASDAIPGTPPQKNISRREWVLPGQDGRVHSALSTRACTRVNNGLRTVRDCLFSVTDRFFFKWPKKSSQSGDIMSENINQCTLFRRVLMQLWEKRPRCFSEKKKTGQSAASWYAPGRANRY